tara:strand:- start:704 stop:1369 length:666 start_codon:yes stop_codon:yes gene_type:complete
MHEIFLDTETTGLSVEKDDRIIEIACIETRDLIPTNKVFYTLINPERPISEEAFKVHGYTNDVLKKEKKFSEIADEFLKFIGGKKLIIHNAPFDITFLNHELRKINKALLNIKNVIDTLEIARSKFPGTSNSLDNLCKKFNIDNSMRKKHNALLDCKLLREVYINLIGQKEPTLSLNEVNYSSDNNDNKKNLNFKKVLLPSKDEMSEHKNFLKSQIKKNYF